MKIKNLSIIILMTIFFILIGSKVEATNEDANISNNIEENIQYNVEQEISVKILPLINSMENAKINGNIQVMEIINDWARIEGETGTGWVRVHSLKTVISNLENIAPEIDKQPEEEIQETPEENTEKEPEKNEEQTEEISMNKIGYVDAEGLILREEPTTSSKELDSLARNDKVEIIGKAGNWYKVKWNDQIGYLSGKYVSDTKTSETTSRGGSVLNRVPASTKVPEEPKKEENKTEENKVEEPAKEEQRTEASNTTGAAVVEYAKQYLGYKYVSGGASPSKGFDCSGFTSYVYKYFGVSLNRTSKGQINNGVAVEKSNLQPGDLVIFNNDANTAIGHVGIYVGNGNFIHASNPKDGVKITTLETGYYQKRYVGARRVI